MRPADATTTESPAPGAAPAAYPGTPRWVKVSAVAAVALVLLFIALHLAGIGMPHGMHSVPGA